MTTQISGTTGVSKVQDGVVTNDDLVGGITSNKLTGDAIPLGVGQTWQNVSASRALAATYTNNTGRPIQVSVVVFAATGTYSTLSVDGVVIASGGNSVSTGSRHSISAVIPPDSTYTLTGSSFVYWAELR